MSHDHDCPAWIAVLVLIVAGVLTIGVGVAVFAWTTILPVLGLIWLFGR